jgi:hypothetical protein
MREGASHKYRQPQVADSETESGSGMATDPITTVHPSLACTAGRRAANEVTGSKPLSRFASELGKMGKGVPKTLTVMERRRRAASLAEARKTRWPVKQNDKA